ncbi:MmyB family transcriptional regulator [Nocardia tengchongensis]
MTEPTIGGADHERGAAGHARGSAQHTRVAGDRDRGGADPAHGGLDGDHAIADHRFGGMHPEHGPPAPPAFGSTLRRLRERRGISRERLAFGAGVSASYITRMERGDRVRPTEQVLIAVVRYLDRVATLTADEFRHLHDLAALGHGPPHGDPKFTDAMAANLEIHLPHPAAYLDRQLNVLAANAAHLRTFPGLSEQGNFLRWILIDDLARHVLVDWAHELRRAVATLRGLLAMDGGETTDDTRLLTEFGRFEPFRRIWTGEHRTLTGAPTRMRLRDAVSGAPYTLLWQILRDQTASMSPGQPVFIVGLPTASQPEDRTVGP